MLEKWLERHSQLLNGNYDEGWPSHEDIRTGNPDFKDRFEPTPTFDKPIWDGRRAPFVLLINADFGMGDTIQFWRFVQMAKDRVYFVYVRCDSDFKPLFNKERTGIEVIGKEEPLPHFDAIIHMMALPKVLGIKKSDISGKPYISPNDSEPMDRILRSLLSTTRFSKLGMCWQGNPFNPRDHLRSIPDLLVQKYWIWPGTKFFSLNKIGEIPAEFCDMKPYMRDWNETAHLLQLMDLVITVDTAVAHLSGALGRPTWLIVPTEDPDWRWGREGSETLWYDSVRLYRNRDWEETMNGIAEDILRF
jgi:hypothetical protein